MVERLLPHHGGQGVDDVLVGNGAVRGDATFGVLVVFTTEPHQHVRDRLPEHVVLLLTPFLQGAQPLYAGLVQRRGRRAKTVGLRVIERPHVRLGHGRDGAKDALLAAARAGAVARNERVVVPAHHEHVSQGGGLRVLRPCVVVEAQVLLRRVGQEVEECGALRR